MFTGNNPLVKTVLFSLFGLLLVCAIALPFITTQSTTAQTEITQTTNTYTPITSTTGDRDVRYAWIDAQSNGTRLALADDEDRPHKLPFPVTICDTTSDQLVISNDGSVLFGVQDGTIDAINTSLDQTNFSGEFIAPFWDDIDDTHGDVYLHTMGETPNRRVIIEWYRRPHYSKASSLDNVTFAMILYEKTSNIKFQYKDTHFGVETWDKGASATVGLRCSNTPPVSFSFNEPKIEDNFAICLQRSGEKPCDWQPVESVSISGPSVGFIQDVYGGPYAFKATILPDTVGYPVTYTWEATGYTKKFRQSVEDTENTALFGWDTPGTKVVTVTVASPAGGNISTTHTIQIPEEPQVQFAESMITVLEYAGEVQVPVTVIPSPTEPITVECVSLDPPSDDPIYAIPNEDYIPITQTLFFAPGVSEQSCSLLLFNDNIPEEDESIILELRNPSNDRLGTPMTTTVTILDDDPEVFVNFSQATYNIREEDGNVPITVILSEPLSQTVEMNYTTRDDSARAGSDYTRSSGTLTFAAGETTEEFSVPITQDPHLEGNERFTIQLTIPPSFRETLLPGSPMQAEVIIEDAYDDTGSNQPSANPSIVQFSRANYRVVEGKEQEATIVIERTGKTDQQVSVNVATFDETATSRIDYARQFTSVTFDPGILTQNITIPITDDQEIEGNEIVILSLNSPKGNATLGTQQTTRLIIEDSDGPPQGVLQLESAVYYVNEEEPYAEIIVKRTGGFSGTVSVSYTITDLLATVEQDYRVPSGNQLTFAGGEQERTIRIPIIPDETQEVEGDENFLVTIYDLKGGAVIGAQKQAVVTIIDGNSVPAGTIQFRADTYYVDEEGETATILVDRIGGHSGEISVDYATSAGTAKPGLDYEDVAGRLKFADGVTSRSFVVPIKQNMVINDVETVHLTLGNGVSRPATESESLQTTSDDTPTEGKRDRAILTITDGGFEPRGVLEDKDKSLEVNEGDEYITITLRRAQGNKGTMTITYLTKELTQDEIHDEEKKPATIGSDVETINSTEIIFDSGDNEDKSVPIRIINDNKYEKTEVFAVEFKVHYGNKSGPADDIEELWVYIKDDDDPNSVTQPSKGFLTVSSPTLVDGQYVLLMAILLDENEEMLYNVDKETPGVQVRIGESYPISLHDDGNEDITAPNDGIYSALVPLYAYDGNTATLLVNGKEVPDSPPIPLTWITSANLIVLTDWKELYNEFIDTGMITEVPAEDMDGNLKHDFFDVVDMLGQYAQKQQGVVFDIPSETKKIDIGYNNQSYVMGGSLGRHKKSVLLDQFIATLANHHHDTLQYLAIIGDDQVVPFYRVPDPTNLIAGKKYKEQDYPKKYINPPGALNNAVLVDMETKGYIMSDVPYSIQSYQEIDHETTHNAIPLPEPNIGIGRIFATRPNNLVQAIRQYQEPLDLTWQPNTLPLHFFIGLDKTPSSPDYINFPQRFESMGQRLIQWDSVAGRYQDTTNTPENIVQALKQGTLVSFWGGHGAHKHLTLKHTGNIANDFLLNTSIDALPETDTRTPTLATFLSCHTGLSVSDFPDGKYNGTEETHPHYQGSLMRSLLDKGITVFAPTSYAYIDHKNFTDANLHELMITLFNNTFLHNKAAPTVGDVWKSVFPIYNSRDPDLIDSKVDRTRGRLYHLAGAYGTMLYGLPTQPIHHTTEHFCNAPQPVAMVQQELQPLKRTSYATFTLDIEVPYMDALQEPDGTTLFRILHDGTHVAPVNGYVLPEIVRTLELPENLRVTNVELTSSPPYTNTESVTLTKSLIGTTDGTLVMTDSEELPGVYPQQIYTYTVTPETQGSLLTLSVIPLQYVAETHQVTTYQQLSFRVDTVVIPDFFPGEKIREGTGLASTTQVQSSPSLSSQQKFDVSELFTNNPSEQYMNVWIDFTQSETVQLVWQVKEDAEPISSAVETLVSTHKGLAVTACKLDTTGWKPGNKEIAVELQRTNGSIDKLPQQPVLVKGLAIEDMVTQQAQTYPNTSPQAHWIFKVYDEMGQIRRGIPQDQFTVQITAVPTTTLTNTLLSPPGMLTATGAFTITEQGNSGIYTLDYPLDQVSAGTYQMQVSIQHDKDTFDVETISDSREWIFTKAPPTPTPTPPITSTNPFTVSLPIVQRPEEKK